MMEFEFDKEMDALLKKAAQSGKANAAALVSHLDADEISMFAENALPDKARTQAVSHMADCERCRTILANVIALNAEAEPLTAAIPTVEVAADTASKPSWLAGLLSTRNLAFGFGALALVFAGLVSLSVFRTMNSGTAEVAQADLQETSNKATNPSKEVSDTLDSAMDDSSNSGSATNTLAEDAKSEGVFETNSAATSGRENVQKKESEAETFADRKDMTTVRRARENVSERDLEERATADSDRRNSQPVVADAAPPPPAPAPAGTRSVLTPRSGVAKPRSEAKNDDITVSASESADKVAGASVSTTRRQIEGKTFKRVNGVWYDSVYKNQQTTKVKRATNAFAGLDSGLKKIANDLEGTVVVVWKTKAYKID